MVSIHDGCIPLSGIVYKLTIPAYEISSVRCDQTRAYAVAR